jgi:restriction system protein
MAEVPTFDEYMRPIVVALRRLGGSATIQELYEAVVDDMKLSEAQLGVLHDQDRGNQTEVGYRMAWARTYLKKAGFLTNSERGVWALTRKGLQEEVDPARVRKQVGLEYTARDTHDADIHDDRHPPTPVPAAEASLDTPETTATWRQRLIRKLLGMAPDGMASLPSALRKTSVWSFSKRCPHFGLAQCPGASNSHKKFDPCDICSNVAMTYVRIRP